eukprot:Nk52_evm27s236 gene=Nk52_evmTU27s236
MESSKVSSIVLSIIFAIVVAYFIWSWWTWRLWAVPSAILGHSPPLGFSTIHLKDWTSKTIASGAEDISSEGFVDFGFGRIILEEGWQDAELDENNYLQLNPSKFCMDEKVNKSTVHQCTYDQFAKMLKAMNDYHVLLGLTSSAGHSTLHGYAGSLGHEDVHAEQFKKMNSSYLGYSNYFAPKYSNKEMYARYQGMQTALNAERVKTVFAAKTLGYGNPSKWTSIANTWQTGGISRPNWWSLISRFDRNARTFPGFEFFAGWNDMGYAHASGDLSPTEVKTQMTLMAISKSPIIFTEFPSEMSDEVKQTILNADVIAVNQERPEKRNPSNPVFVHYDYKGKHETADEMNAEFEYCTKENANQTALHFHYPDSNKDHFQIMAGDKCLGFEVLPNEKNMAPFWNNPSATFSKKHCHDKNRSLFKETRALPFVTKRPDFHPDFSVIQLAAKEELDFVCITMNSLTNVEGGLCPWIFQSKPFGVEGSSPEMDLVMDPSRVLVEWENDGGKSDVCSIKETTVGLCGGLKLKTYMQFELMQKHHDGTPMCLDLGRKPVLINNHVVYPGRKKSEPDYWKAAHFDVAPCGYGSTPPMVYWLVDRPANGDGEGTVKFYGATNMYLNGAGEGHCIVPSPKQEPLDIIFAETTDDKFAMAIVNRRGPNDSGNKFQLDMDMAGITYKLDHPVVEETASGKEDAHPKTAEDEGESTRRRRTSPPVFSWIITDAWSGDSECISTGDALTKPVNLGPHDSALFTLQRVESCDSPTNSTAPAPTEES